MIKVLAVIPARYASSRYPKKMLEKVMDKTLVQMVYENAIESNLFSEVVIATDHEDILNHCRGFGAKTYMTSALHESGTDRVAEAAQLMGGAVSFDYVVNIQGDEPLLSHALLEEMIDNFSSKSTIYSAKKKIQDSQELFDPNVVKVVCNHRNNALYFSRSPIPHCRGYQAENWLEQTTYYKHIGIYAFEVNTLLEIVRLSPSELENTEKLEQLRWLHAGYQIKMIETQIYSMGIDTPEDMLKLRQFLSNKNR
jgi:3-deoxy-manno-octulosonate cytidylyltransferase (CMP-KDO synthetase)